MGMTLNIDKTKVMIIKSNKITYDTFVYDVVSLANPGERYRNYKRIL